MNAAMVVLMMVASGAIMAFQGPINAALRGHVGTFESSLVSFCTGTLALVLIVLLTREGQLANLRNISWWHLLGGLIGAVFVTTTLLAAPRIGVTGMIVAALAGQMLAGVVIDHYGWVGMKARAIELPRVLGLLLLVASVALINWNSWKPGPGAAYHKQNPEAGIRNP